MNQIYTHFLHQNFFPSPEKDLPGVKLGRFSLIRAAPAATHQWTALPHTDPHKHTPLTALWLLVAGYADVWLRARLKCSSTTVLMSPWK